MAAGVVKDQAQKLAAAVQVVILAMVAMGEQGILSAPQDQAAALAAAVAITEALAAMLAAVALVSGARVQAVQRHLPLIMVEEVAQMARMPRTHEVGTLALMAQGLVAVAVAQVPAPALLAAEVLAQ
jgi:hypothetical protein